MTTNKSQGKTLSKVGLYIPRPVFIHGQLYIAVSRMKTKMIENTNFGWRRRCNRITTNVVYKEIFENL